MKILYFILVFIHDGAYSESVVNPTVPTHSLNRFSSSENCERAKELSGLYLSERWEASCLPIWVED